MKSAAGADDDALVEQWYDDEERTILLRYLRLSAGDEFQLAAVEVPTPAVREALLSWLRARAPDRPLIEVSLKGLPGSVLVEEITAALPPPSERSPRAVLALTDLAPVRGIALELLPHTAVYVALSFAAFQLDGIFIGATRTAEMRNAALATLALYLAVAWALAPFGNHGLWAALTFSYFARAGTLLWFYPKLVRSVPA